MTQELTSSKRTPLSGRVRTVAAKTSSWQRLPLAIAGVLCVALLYHLVSRMFGPVAGLVGSLVLAVTPVAVAVERTNNADGLLTLSVLVAAWAVIRAVESGRLRWLLVGTVVV